MVHPQEVGSARRELQQASRDLRYNVVPALQERAPQIIDFFIETKRVNTSETMDTWATVNHAMLMIEASDAGME